MWHNILILNSIYELIRYNFKIDQHTYFIWLFRIKIKFEFNDRCF